VSFIGEYLAQGHSVYGTLFDTDRSHVCWADDTPILGTTTGFGGSADTRTRQTEDLQRALFQMQHSGVLPLAKDKQTTARPPFDNVLPNSDPYVTTAMPEAWVRGTMLVRGNTLARGHSAVRYNTIQSLFCLLNQDLIPLVPLRGSISASGDLCPLSYLAGVLEGNPDIQVWSGTRSTPRALISSQKAMEIVGKTPIIFGPKEGLGVLNGTAVSAAVGALAIFDANNLALLSQVLTAMCVEAISGTSESFNEFLSATRPHEGQTEASRNILRCLSGSRLARDSVSQTMTVGEEGDAGLFQDRYPTRTAPQWIGPQLEDLLLAHRQISVELNSTTDNPLVDVTGGTVHHGGNFQAMSVTSAMEKTRQAIQHIGKMLFAQCNELMHPSLSNGLPPNLVADEPSLSYTMKGVDINMAAYVSELGFLANPVGNHVHSAEMSNQAINSLAFISARYTHTAIDLLSLISAAYLYSLCQALDLRVMQFQFLQSLQPVLQDITNEAFPFLTKIELEKLRPKIWKSVIGSFSNTANMDSSTRFKQIFESIQPTIIKFFTSDLTIVFDFVPALCNWTKTATERSLSLFIEIREAYSMQPDATPFLGAASKRMYVFVREELRVPFHRGLVDHPTSPPAEGATQEEFRERRTTGSRISIIYEALRSSRAYEPVIECIYGL
jgi:phenylalanine ammonia-lyase